MTPVEDALRVVLALPIEERRAVHLKLGETLADSRWPSDLHPSWKAELDRRDAMPEDDDIPWEVVKQDMEAMFSEINRERDARGED